MAANAKSGLVKFAIVKFDDRNRYGKTGVPSTLLFAGGQRVIVEMKDTTIDKAGKRNRFAKVVVPHEDADKAELIELLGEVGSYADEFQAYQLHFGIKPCRYPKPAEWALTPSAEPAEAGRLDCTSLHVFAVDNVGTRDIDDALSLTPLVQLPAGVAEAIGAPSLSPSALVLGIHVSDVASRLPTDSPLFAWAAARCASAYNSGIGDAEGQRGGSVPMLPPQVRDLPAPPPCAAFHERL